MDHASGVEEVLAVRRQVHFALQLTHYLASDGGIHVDTCISDWTEGDSGGEELVPTRLVVL